MNLTKILFALLLVIPHATWSFENFSFFQKKHRARKAGLEKIIISTVLFAANGTKTDSRAVNIVQSMSALGGSACAIAGIGQILVDVLAEPEAKSTLQRNTSRLDTAVNKVITDKVFLTGAGLGLVGLFLQNNYGSVSDTSLACNVAALTLMGLAIGARVSADYGPQIATFFNQ